MIDASPPLLGHLIAAAEGERDRLSAIHELVGEDWPPGFDANDISLYDSLVGSLRDALDCGKHELDFWGKPLVFLLLPIPGYVEANRQELSTEEYEGLKAIYSRWPWQESAREFPA